MDRLRKIAENVKIVFCRGEWEIMIQHMPRLTFVLAAQITLTLNKSPLMITRHSEETRSAWF